MINRHELVSRHNPVCRTIDYHSPLTVGNGELAYTVDMTGMQTLYKEYEKNHVSLCTMSQWGWHTTPVSGEQYGYTMADIEMTEYDYNNRKVKYAVEIKKGNESAYHWLRQNPHRLNLARIGLIWEDDEISADAIHTVFQELKLYEGRIESRFVLNGIPCEVITSCDFKRDVLGFKIKSSALLSGRLKVRISFPYGHHDMTASDWNCSDKHTTNISIHSETQLHMERILDEERYYVAVKCGEPTEFIQKSMHVFELQSKSDTLSFTVAFSEIFENDLIGTEQVMESSRTGWKDFWENCGAVDLHKSKDKRANELERRIILSQYVSAIQSCGSIPPQETGLTCNSWYGKFHLEMHLWHSAYLPLWNCSKMLKKSLPWYSKHLPEAKENASRNGYEGARWPKMTSYDGVDSPSTIATLLIWQQPHIIYMLELTYKSGEGHIV